MTKAATPRPPLSLTPASAQNTLAMLRGSDLFESPLWQAEIALEQNLTLKTCPASVGHFLSLLIESPELSAPVAELVDAIDSKNCCVTRSNVAAVHHST